MCKISAEIYRAYYVIMFARYFKEMDVLATAYDWKKREGWNGHGRIANLPSPRFLGTTLT